MTAILDSSVIFAAMDRDDSAHSTCTKLLQRMRAEVILPCTVLEECAYMAGHWLGVDAEATLVRSVADGELLVEHITADDWRRVAELLVQYRDLDLGSVDGSIVALAERLGVGRLLTLDRRHFGVLRPKHCDAFELLPN